MSDDYDTYRRIAGRIGQAFRAGEKDRMLAEAMNFRFKLREDVHTWMGRYGEEIAGAGGILLWLSLLLYLFVPALDDMAVAAIHAEGADMAQLATMMAANLMVSSAVLLVLSYKVGEPGAAAIGRWLYRRVVEVDGGG